MKRFVLASFAATGVLVGMFGMLAFGILLLDFQCPGLFKIWYVTRENMGGNMVLLILFGLQHSIMARKGLKRVVTAMLPPQLERSFYVLATGFVLLLLAGLWSPTDPPLYDLRETSWGYLLHGAAIMGLLLILWSGLVFGGMDMIGVDALLRIISGKKQGGELPFATPGPYRFVRHPIYLGFMMLFWFTPAMTHDHLLFAEVMTAYLLLGATLEERDLKRRFGQQYHDYQKSTPMFLPFFKLGR